jgi:hypothetical protein
MIACCPHLRLVCKIKCPHQILHNILRIAQHIHFVVSSVFEFAELLCGGM